MTANADVCRLSAEQLARLRRAHIALALVEAVVEGGHDDPPVADILARAGVSRKSFYRLFDGKDDARRFAAELLWLRAVDHVRRAGAGHADDPVARAHAAAVALSRLVTSHPRHARLVLADAAAAGLPELLSVLDPVAPPAPPPRGQTQKRKRVDVSQDRDAGDRAVEAAIRGEGGGPAALLARVGRDPHADALGAQARRALAFLLERPGAGGAQVQRALGHRHASQTSRLLHRLRGEGLVVASGAAPRVGWRLTRAGRAAARERIA